MLKRCTALFLLFVLVSISGCSNFIPNLSKSNSNTKQQIAEEQEKNSDGSSASNHEKIDKETTVDTDKPSPESSSKPSVVIPSTGLTISEDAVKVENTPITGEIKEEEKVPVLQEEIVVQTSHTALPSTEYYQYTNNQLSDNEKEVYKLLVEAIKNCKNIIGVKNYHVSNARATQIIKMVVADYPQFFYLSKGMQVLYNVQTRETVNVILFYTDGTLTDDIKHNGADYEYITTANRATIAQKIRLFNSDAKKILEKIPTTLSEIEKEKWIFDYITTTVTYDDVAIKNISPTGNIIGHAFDSYGALCEKKSVCEGYSELFQYLCNCVGINATPISGMAGGGGHMWNAVNIDGDWYQIDVTWGDPFKDNVPYYQYFNLTTSQMISFDHTIESDGLAVPDCTATKNIFHKVFALDLQNGNIPENYQRVLDMIQKNNESYLCVYVGNINLSDEKIYEYITGKKSVMHKYINDKGYGIKISSGYSIRGQYYYFHIQR